MRSSWALIVAVFHGWAACSTGRGPAPPPPTGDPPPEEPQAAATAESEPAPPLPIDGSFYEPDRAGGSVPILRPDAPNIRYAEMAADACREELARRAIRVQRAPHLRDVTTPLWLRGPLHGVTFRLPVDARRRLYSAAEVLDCRLLLALDDFAELLEAHDIVDVIHLSAFRSRSEYGCTKKYVGKQHCAALALDIGSFRKRDGSSLVVDRDFEGRIGRSTCAELPTDAPPRASELRTIVCEAARRALFHVILTPNYNVQHKDHLHVELTPDADWMLIQ